MNDSGSEDDVFFGPVTTPELNFRKKKRIDELDKTVLNFSKHHAFDSSDENIENESPNVSVVKISKKKKSIDKILLKERNESIEKSSFFSVPEDEEYATIDSVSLLSKKFSELDIEKSNSKTIISNHSNTSNISSLNSPKIMAEMNQNDSIFEDQDTSCEVSVSDDNVQGSDLMSTHCSSFDYYSFDSKEDNTFTSIAEISDDKTDTKDSNVEFTKKNLDDANDSSLFVINSDETNMNDIKHTKNFKTNLENSLKNGSSKILISEVSNKGFDSIEALNNKDVSNDHVILDSQLNLNESESIFIIKSKAEDDTCSILEKEVEKIIDNGSTKEDNEMIQETTSIQSTSDEHSCIPNKSHLSINEVNVESINTSLNKTNEHFNRSPVILSPCTFQDASDFSKSVSSEKICEINLNNAENSSVEFECNDSEISQTIITSDHDSALEVSMTLPSPLDNDDIQSTSNEHSWNFDESDLSVNAEDNKEAINMLSNDKMHLNGSPVALSPYEFQKTIKPNDSICSKDTCKKNLTTLEELSVEAECKINESEKVFEENQNLHEKLNNCNNMEGEESISNECICSAEKNKIKIRDCNETEELSNDASHDSVENLQIDYIYDLSLQEFEFQDMKNSTSKKTNGDSGCDISMDASIFLDETVLLKEYEKVHTKLDANLLSQSFNEMDNVCKELNFENCSEMIHDVNENITHDKVDTTSNLSDSEISQNVITNNNDSALEASIILPLPLDNNSQSQEFQFENEVLNKQRILKDIENINNENCVKEELSFYTESETINSDDLESDISEMDSSNQVFLETHNTENIDSNNESSFELIMDTSFETSYRVNETKNLELTENNSGIKVRKSHSSNTTFEFDIHDTDGNDILCNENEISVTVREILQNVQVETTFIEDFELKTKIYNTSEVDENRSQLASVQFSGIKSNDLESISEINSSGQIPCETPNTESVNLNDEINESSFELRFDTSSENTYVEDELNQHDLKTALRKSFNADETFEFDIHAEGKNDTLHNDNETSIEIEKKLQKTQVDLGLTTLIQDFELKTKIFDTTNFDGNNSQLESLEGDEKCKFVDFSIAKEITINDGTCFIQEQDLKNTEFTIKDVKNLLSSLVNKSVINLSNDIEAEIDTSNVGSIGKENNKPHTFDFNNGELSKNCHSGKEILCKNQVETDLKIIESEIQQSLRDWKELENEIFDFISIDSEEEKNDEKNTSTKHEQLEELQIDVHDSVIKSENSFNAENSIEENDNLKTLMSKDNVLEINECSTELLSEEKVAENVNSKCIAFEEYKNKRSSEVVECNFGVHQETLEVKIDNTQLEEKVHQNKSESNVEKDSVHLTIELNENDGSLGNEEHNDTKFEIKGMMLANSPEMEKYDKIINDEDVVELPGNTIDLQEQNQHSDKMLNELLKENNTVSVISEMDTSVELLNVQLDSDSKSIMKPSIDFKSLKNDFSGNGLKNLDETNTCEKQLFGRIEDISSILFPHDSFDNQCDSFATISDQSSSKINKTDNSLASPQPPDCSNGKLFCVAATPITDIGTCEKSSVSFTEKYDGAKISDNSLCLDSIFSTSTFSTDNLSISDVKPHDQSAKTDLSCISNVCVVDESSFNEENQKKKFEEMSLDDDDEDPFLINNSFSPKKDITSKIKNESSSLSVSAIMKLNQECKSVENFDTKHIKTSDVACRKQTISYASGSKDSSVLNDQGIENNQVNLSMLEKEMFKPNVSESVLDFNESRLSKENTSFASNVSKMSVNLFDSTADLHEHSFNIEEMTVLLNNSPNTSRIEDEIIVTDKNSNLSIQPERKSDYSPGISLLPFSDMLEIEVCSARKANLEKMPPSKKKTANETNIIVENFDGKTEVFFTEDDIKKQLFSNEDLIESERFSLIGKLDAVLSRMSKSPVNIFQNQKQKISKTLVKSLNTVSLQQNKSPAVKRASIKSYSLKTAVENNSTVSPKSPSIITKSSCSSKLSTNVSNVKQTPSRTCKISPQQIKSSSSSCNVTPILKTSKSKNISYGTFAQQKTNATKCPSQLTPQVSAVKKTPTLFKESCSSLKKPNTSQVTVKKDESKKTIPHLIISKTPKVTRNKNSEFIPKSLNPPRFYKMEDTVNSTKKPLSKPSDDCKLQGKALFNLKKNGSPTKVASKSNFADNTKSRFGFSSSTSLKIKTPNKYSKIQSPVGKYIQEMPPPPLIQIVKADDKHRVVPSFAIEPIKTQEQDSWKDVKPDKPVLPPAKYSAKPVKPQMTKITPSKPTFKFQSNSIPVITKHIGPSKVLKDCSYLANDDSILDTSISKLPKPMIKPPTKFSIDMNASKIQEMDVSHSHTLSRSARKMK